LPQCGLHRNGIPTDTFLGLARFNALGRRRYALLTDRPSACNEERAMPHDLLLAQPVDRSRIELVEDHGLRFWTRELHCSAEHLLDAIEAVGADPEVVGDYLAMRSYIGAKPGHFSF
jgi:hypothetical protein